MTQLPRPTNLFSEGWLALHSCTMASATRSHGSHYPEWLHTPTQVLLVVVGLVSLPPPPSPGHLCPLHPQVHHWGRTKAARQSGLHCWWGCFSSKQLKKVLKPAPFGFVTKNWKWLFLIHGETCRRVCKLPGPSRRPVLRGVS